MRITDVVGLTAQATVPANVAHATAATARPASAAVGRKPV
jgi:hypothetical protein